MAPKGNTNAAGSWTKYLGTLPGKECWNFVGALTHNGYGRIVASSKRYQIHRYFYEKYRGFIPDNHQIDHLCQNRKCFNPTHLEAVTAATNVQRGARARLTPAIIGQIRQRAALGERQTRIAHDVGVGQDEISRIIHFKRWATV